MDLHLDVPIENTPFMNASKKNNGAHCMGSLNKLQ